MDRQDFYNECRNKFPSFTYKDYSYTLNDDEIAIEYSFSIDGLSEFHPTWKIARLNNTNYDIDMPLLDEMVFSLGMVELISYWKISCPPTVTIKGHTLSADQILWWKKLYWGGLGEFYYTNGINENEHDFMAITFDSATSTPFNKKESALNKDSMNPLNVMVPIGGGKDSVVSVELLKDKTNVFPYIINSRGATESTVEVASLKDKTIYAKRTLDKNMLDLNKEGYLNGHTPFSALVAFSSIIAGYLNGVGYVALSNENSANESTVEGSYVNHQYSKSFEFEEDFRHYESNYIGSGVYYFSFLRPLSELQIAMLFSRFKNYHSVFKSCNVGSKQDIWCGHCPKCLFVYIILSPFLSIEELDGIFGKRLFEDESLLEDFEKLCGLVPEKPFECVGSRDEVNTSLTETISQYEANNIPLPVLLNHYKKLETQNTIPFKNYKGQFASTHGLNDFFAKIIKDAINE